MNVFDEDSISIHTSGIVAAWADLIAAIRELLGSYNAGPRGINHPAELNEITAKSVSVRCSTGNSPESPFSQKIVMIALTLKDGELRILCVIQRWVQIGSSRSAPDVESEKKLDFRLHTDAKSLRLKGNVLTPFEAAEKILKDSLLKR